LEYLKKKSIDLKKGIVYTDNEFAEGNVRLAFELDLKSKAFKENWFEQMMNDAENIAKVLAKKYGKATCHCLTRPPYQTKDGTWKYHYRHDATRAQIHEKACKKNTVP
jgi:hypothetical protein